MQPLRRVRTARCPLPPEGERGGERQQRGTRCRWKRLRFPVVLLRKCPFKLQQLQKVKKALLSATVTGGLPGVAGPGPWDSSPSAMSTATRPQFPGARCPRDEGTRVADGAGSLSHVHGGGVAFFVFEVSAMLPGKDRACGALNWTCPGGGWMDVSQGFRAEGQEAPSQVSASPSSRPEAPAQRGPTRKLMGTLPGPSPVRTPTPRTEEAPAGTTRTLRLEKPSLLTERSDQAALHARVRQA